MRVMGPAPAPTRRWVLGLVGVGCAGAAAGLALYRFPVGMLDPSNPRVSLADVEGFITRRFGVSEITVAAVAGRIERNDLLLFDVRTADEFQRGHLPAAIRVDPDETAESFLRQHGDRLRAHRGGPIVFYCSVGMRSSIFIDRIGAALEPAAAGGLFNLRGGLFRWVAQGGALVSDDRVGALHPYDANWETLLQRTLSAP